MKGDSGVLRVGQRVRSQVCMTEVVIVKPGSGGVRITCGGYPMVDAGSPADEPSAPPLPGQAGGSLLGKRYTAVADEAFEVLVTRAGDGTLGDGAANGEPLRMKEASQLPASD